MMIDFQGILVNQLTAYPDWVFGATFPIQPADIKETILIEGSTGTTIAINGTADQQE